MKKLLTIFLLLVFCAAPGSARGADRMKIWFDTGGAPFRLTLDHPDARLYQGSWLEWSMQPGAPRESGPPAEPR